MSYLLKALEKAEKERERQSIDEPVSYTQTQEASRLPFGLIVFVVLALGATLLKLLIPVSQEPIAEVTEKKEGAVVASQQEKIIVPESLQLKEQALEPILITPDSNVRNTIADGPSAVNEAQDEISVEQPEKIPELYELSKSTLAKIPTLTLESHIYSSAAEYRSVVINGRTFKEGMMINAQVVLHAITNKGIVLEVAGQKVSLDKGISWVASRNAK